MLEIDRYVSELDRLCKQNDLTAVIVYRSDPGYFFDDDLSEVKYLPKSVLKANLTHFLIDDSLRLFINTLPPLSTLESVIVEHVLVSTFCPHAQTDHDVRDTVLG
jgi:hypothetical protein